MTIKELYELTKDKDILDYEIQIQYGDDGGFYDGYRNVEIDIVGEDGVGMMISGLIIKHPVLLNNKKELYKGYPLK